MLNASDSKNVGMVKTELQVDKDADITDNNNINNNNTNTNNLASALSIDDDSNSDDPTKSIFEDSHEDDDMDTNINPNPQSTQSQQEPPPLISTDQEDIDTNTNIDTVQTTQNTKATTTASVNVEESKDKESLPLTPQNVIKSQDTEEKADEEKDDGDKDKEEKEEEEEEDNRTEEEKERAKKISQIDECVKLFPKLEEGLDINIKFSDANHFEENPGYRMFSHYGFKLFHGWIVDPKEEELHKLIGEKSYDETIDFLISDPKKDATEEEKKALEDDKQVVRKFFAEVQSKPNKICIIYIFHNTPYQLMGNLSFSSFEHNKINHK